MGFVIWYRVEFRDAPDAAPALTVSNDLLDGDFALDGDITVESWSGAHAGRFEVLLRDLPLERARLLSARHALAATGAGPLLVDIRLGYFDDPASRRTTVLRGAVTEVHARVDARGELTTEVRGQELAGYRLLQARPFAFDRAGTVGFADVARAIGAAAGVTVQDGGVTGDEIGNTAAAGTALAALAQLAEKAGVAVAVRDGQAFLGEAVPIREPVRFAPAQNIVHQNRRDADPADLLAPDPAARTRYDLTVLGDPELRVGRRAVIVPPGATAAAPGQYELEYVLHSFTRSAGYVCEVSAIEVKAGPPATLRRGALAPVDRFRGLVKSALDNRPAVDVGDVVSYRAGGDDPAHRVTMRYGQPRSGESRSGEPRSGERPSPAVTDPLPDDAPQLHDKPLAAPFAWDRCGLVVPVYPGMRALLGHNRGDVDDPVIAGFVWSEAAGHTPPPSLDGDYWLSLPTAVAGGVPAGKGVNDLTDATGHRTIQARGLTITVADEQLPDVGTRPPVPQTLDFEIVHEKGTTVRVAPDGSVTVETGGKDITLGNGTASITLSGGTITLHGTSVEVG